MNNDSKKDERIKFLENAVSQLLDERMKWQKKAYLLENKLTSLSNRTVDNIPVDTTQTSDVFLAQMGELVRPMVHDMHGQLNIIEGLLGKANNNLNEGSCPYQHTNVKESLILCIATVEFIKKRLVGLSYLGGKTPDLVMPIDINAVINEIIAYTERRNKSIAIALDLESKLPRLVSDKEIIYQIIMNLLTNAIEACDSRDGRIYIATSLCGSNLEITIKDNGIGIYPSEKEKIFDLHYTTKKFGFGIGLHLVKKAVDFHKGKIFCESTPDRGTTFVVQLPYTPGSAQ